MSWRLRPVEGEVWLQQVQDLQQRAELLAKDRHHTAAAAAALALDALAVLWPALNPSVVAKSCELAWKARRPMLSLDTREMQYLHVAQEVARWLGEHDEVDPDDPVPPLTLARVAPLGQEPQEPPGDPVPPPEVPMPVEVVEVEAPPADPPQPADLGDARHRPRHYEASCLPQPADLGDAPMQPWECGHAPGDPVPAPVEQEPPAAAPAPPPADTTSWFSTTEVMELVGVSRSLLLKLALTLDEGTHYARDGHRFLWSAAGAEAVENRPRRRPGKSPEERRALAAARQRERRARLRELEQERVEQERDAQALADLDRLLPALR